MDSIKYAISQTYPSFGNIFLSIKNQKPIGTKQCTIILCMFNKNLIDMIMVIIIFTSSLKLYLNE